MESPEVSINSDSLLEHAAWIRQLALELVCDPGTADDLIQETWLAFLRARPDTERPLRPWLARVIRNAAALRARRRVGRATREQVVAQPELLPSSVELVVRAEQQQRLVDSVLALAEPYRSAVLLRYFEGLTPMEIARAQGLPAATVRTHLHRGLEQLRGQLDREHGGDRKAWILMLQPLMQRSEPALGVGTGVGAGLAATALVVASLLAIFFAYRALGDAGAEEPGSLGLPLREELANASESEASLPPHALGERVEGSPASLAEAADRRSVQLVDRRTGLPLGDYTLRAGGQRLRTDGEGRVELAAALAEITPIDDERLGMDAFSSHGARQTRPVVREALQLPEGEVIAIASGPTFRLELSPPAAAELDNLEARLISRGPSEYDDDGRARLIAPVRAAGEAYSQPWLRFAPIPGGTESAQGTWELELRDTEGLWWGLAPLNDVLPRVAPVIALELQPAAVLRGHVESSTGRDLDELTVSLHPESDPDRVAYHCAVDERGDFLLRWIQPDEYVLRVAGNLATPYLANLALRAGAHHVHDVVLGGPQSAGPIAGTIRSSSGAYEGQLLVFLYGASDDVLDVFPTTWRSEGGSLVASFAFDQAPPGPLHLDVVSLADAVTFQLDVDELRAPNEEVGIDLLDERPATNWGFEVLDHTGVEVEEFEIEVRVNGGDPRRFRSQLSSPSEGGSRTRSWSLIAGNMRWNRFEGPAPLRNLPLDARVSWTIRAEGSKPVSGDSSGFVHASLDLRLATVRLDPQ